MNKKVMRYFMRYVSVLVSWVLLLSYLVVVHQQFEVGGLRSPRMGVFLDPFAGFWRNAARADAPMRPTVLMDSLSGEVGVWYDDRMVPHIFAPTLADAYRVQGYITAQHRLWQMEFQTLATEGRVSEIIGKKALEYDRLQRRMGLPQSARQTAERWKSFEEYAYVEAYMQGVNDYIRQLTPRDYPLEYKILDYQPAEWSPYRTALVLKSMINTLARLDDDVEHTNALQLLGREAFELLYPEYNPAQSPVVPTGTSWQFGAKEAEDSLRLLIDKNFTTSHLAEKAYPFVGSNNWAVAGAKTASGAPILCNDPHLNLTLPSIWYELQIHTPQGNAYGVSLPGMPGIIIGFNEDIAWGMTNVGRDVLDWYKVNWTDSTKRFYRYEGTTRDARLRTETILVRGEEPVLDTIRYTHHGPVVFESDSLPKNNLALRWMGNELSEGNELSVFPRLNCAQNYEEYVTAIKEFDCPAQNFVFASKNGDIAIWAQGRFPLKAKWQGRFVLDGSKAQHEWSGFIPKEHNPHIKNPMRHFVASANQHSTDETYPYYYRGNFDDFRARFINGSLAQMSSITKREMANLQNSTTSLFPKEALPVMLAAVRAAELNPLEAKWLEIEKAWDGDFALTSAAAAFFEGWFEELYALTWDEMDTLKSPNLVAKPEVWVTIDWMNRYPSSIYFDNKSTPQRETLAEIATISFKNTCKAMQQWEDKNGKSVNWSDFKNTAVPHLARIGGLGVENIAVGGHRHAPNAVSSTHAPSWRMIVELEKDKTTAWGVYPGGQSGNPGSRFYDNAIGKWAKGEYFELLFLTKPPRTKGAKMIDYQMFTRGDLVLNPPAAKQ